MTPLLSQSDREKLLVTMSGVVPSSIPFSLRPRSFLTELRSRRDIDLALRVKAKRKEKLNTQSRTKRVTQKSLAAASMASLPPSLAAILQAALPAKRKGLK